MNTLSQADMQNIGQVERIISIGGGAMLALMALRRAPFAMLLAAAGWWLIYRGAMGRCAVYRALGLSTAECPPAPQAAQMPREELVDETVEESFPASDPPGWHTGSSFTQVSE